MRITSHFFAVGLLIATSSTAALAADPFTVTSSTFKDGGTLAVKQAGNVKNNPNCVGENVSPALQWSNIPNGTQSLAILMTDPEGRNGVGGVVYWLAYGIAASVAGLAEGEGSKPSDKFVGGKNIAGVETYLGPCPPPGLAPHHFTFVVVATDLDPKALPAGLSLAELLAKLEGHSKGATGIVGLFKQP